MRTVCHTHTYTHTPTHTMYYCNNLPAIQNLKIYKMMMNIKEIVNLYIYIYVNIMQICEIQDTIRQYHRSDHYLRTVVATSGSETI